MQTLIRRRIRYALHALNDALRQAEKQEVPVEFFLQTKISSTGSTVLQIRLKKPSIPEEGGTLDAS